MIPKFVTTGAIIILDCIDGLFECRILDASYWDSVAFTNDLTSTPGKDLGADWFLLKKEDYGKTWSAIEIVEGEDNKPPN